MYHPYYMSFSNLKFFKVGLSSLFFTKAVKKIYNKLGKQDIIYSHFWDCGIVAANIQKQNENIPIVVANGESQIRVKKMFPQYIIDKSLNKIKAVICVSNKNKKESLELGLIKSFMNVKIIPNGVDSEKFYYYNKKYLARKNLGFDYDCKIGIFVGSFIQRKGIKIIEEAVKNIENVRMIYVGKGKYKPSEYLFCGSVANDQLIHYLNSADFFVLPTLAEGCCNAIIEAMACGLPIISSDLDFNYDILDKSFSILINPLSVQEVSKAIKLVINDHNLYLQLKKGSLLKSKDLTLKKRGYKIRDLIEEILNKNEKISN